MNKRHVTVSGVRLKFASAHMATLGNELEPLHGHNYSVSVKVEGSLTNDFWVIDFSKIKGITRDICDQLDHKFLLQAKSNLLSSTLEQETWHLSFDNRVYQLPQSDVAVLAIENTTAELLAEDLRQAQTALSEITGEFTSDDLLGEIFSSFCIGK